MDPVEGVLRGLEQDLVFVDDIVNGDDNGRPVVHPTARSI
jgi:hypothetical protein